MQKIEPRSSGASKKALWAKRIPSCSCLCFFAKSQLEEPKNCPTNRAKARFNRVWAERKPRAIFHSQCF